MVRHPALPPFQRLPERAHHPLHSHDVFPTEFWVDASKLGVKVVQIGLREHQLTLVAH